MKKTLISGLMVLSILGMGACGDNHSKTTKSAWTATTQANGNVEHYRCIGVSKLVKKTPKSKVTVVKGSKECAGKKP